MWGIPIHLWTRFFGVNTPQNDVYFGKRFFLSAVVRITCVSFRTYVRNLLKNTCFVCAFRYSAFRNNRGIDNSIKSFKEVYLSIFAVSREAIFCLFVTSNAVYSLMYHENKPLNFHFIRHKNCIHRAFSPGKRGRMSGLFVFEDVINLK